MDNNFYRYKIKHLNYNYDEIETIGLTCGTSYMEALATVVEAYKADDFKFNITSVTLEVFADETYGVLELNEIKEIFKNNEL